MNARGRFLAKLRLRSTDAVQGDDDVCDLLVASRFDLRTGRQPARIGVSLVERFGFSGLAPPSS